MDLAPCLELDAAAVDPDDVGPTLARLTTGWRLRIVGPEREVLLLRAAALAHGALDEEITTEITTEVLGTGVRTVYCAACHHPFPTTGTAARCPGCGTDLDVADHVSRRHGAFLGVPR
ncbi:dimethylamine monooxygenase subunit DmmA family protein [Actinomycetospora chiangmaiensis]|uniref:dimethylamine monooxygenase subunit DmmA family protein n=1 Tax=Actinomycetospora chiangmaiensis TaxID=402650 RepID=UPI000365C81F|nr:dimethylamine monooxygenase subunit DmmA family protein [Actinomycetospora chiangmaiensis]